MTSPTRSPGTPTTADDDARERVTAALQEFFALRTRDAQPYGKRFTTLWELGAEQVVGGKMLRPLLMLRVLRALRADAPDTGGAAEAGSRTATELAAAIELLHFAFLLHDDVIDNDLIRRGRPNFIGALLTEAAADDASAPITHWARTGGLLMGDLLLAATHQIFARADLATPTRLRLLDLLDHTIVDSVAGEQADVSLSSGLGEPDLGAVLMMAARKTATYTFELPLRVAAILSGASPHVEEALTRAGRHLGLAFQLQDDLLSVFGDPRLHGKDTFSDLREGKLTAIISYARMTSAWPRVQAGFGNPSLTQAEGERMRSLLSECGAEAFVQDLRKQQLASFTAILDSTEPDRLPPSVVGVLRDVRCALEGRTA